MTPDITPPYAATCPKCGAGDVSLRYMSGVNTNEATRTLEGYEHIAYKCQTCDHTWTGPTLDRMLDEAKEGK